MGSQSFIFGNINGISQSDFQKLKLSLEECFEKVAWKNQTLVIRSQGNHHRIKNIFKRIADCIAEGKHGSLLYIGDYKVACIYFGHKRFTAKLFKEPTPPGWWGSGKNFSRVQDDTL